MKEIWVFSCKKMYIVKQKVTVTLIAVHPRNNHNLYFDFLSFDQHIRCSLKHRHTLLLPSLFTISNTEPKSCPMDTVVLDALTNRMTALN